MRWNALLHLRWIHLLPLRCRIGILRSARDIANLPSVASTRLSLLRHKPLWLRRVACHLSAARHLIHLLHGILHGVHAWVWLSHLRAVTVFVAARAGYWRDARNLCG